MPTKILEIMRKLSKKLFSIVCTCLLLMSMSSSNVAEEELVKRPKCLDDASIAANDLCCEYYGENYTYEQYYTVYLIYADLFCS